MTWRFRSYATGSTVGDLGESIGVAPNGQPILDGRTQEFQKVLISRPSHQVASIR